MNRGQSRGRQALCGERCVQCLSLLDSGLMVQCSSGKDRCLNYSLTLVILQPIIVCSQPCCVCHVLTVSAYSRLTEGLTTPGKLVYSNYHCTGSTCLSCRRALIHSQLNSKDRICSTLYKRNTLGKFISKLL